jgi:hypothetical protein
MAGSERVWQDRRRAAELADAFAHRHGVDLLETVPAEVANAKAAAAQLEVVRQALPAVPSAYRPSGALPLTAMLALTFGAAVGVAVGLLAGAAVAFLGVWGATTGVGWAWGRKPGVLLLFLGLALCCLTVPLTGLGAGLTTLYFNRWGKNRSPGGAALFALLSAAAAMAFAWVLFGAHGQPRLEKHFGLAPGGLDGIVLGVAAVGALVAAALAAGTAAWWVSEEKFCEDCQEYMTRAELPPLDLGPTRALALALEEKDLPAALSLLQFATPGVGAPELYACPQCGKGYVEVRVKYRATWPGDKGEKEEKAESWLAASLPVEADEAEWFRSCLPPRAPDEAPAPPETGTTSDGTSA